MRISILLNHPSVNCWTLSESQAQRIATRLPGVEVERCEDVTSFRRSLRGAEVVIVWQFEEQWLRDAPALEWIVTPAAGRDYFNIAPRPGLDIDYSSFHGPLIGETVLGMMLAQCRGLLLSDRLKAANPWPRAVVANEITTLRGARVTILGFGSIGRWIGRLAKSFDAKITGVVRRTGPAPEYFGGGDQLVNVESLDAVLSTSDYLVIALPATAATNRIVDAARIALLPARAVLINVGRGNAVDETALADALLAGRIGGACLDVYQTEPLPEDSPLRHTPNTLLMPHASAIAPQYLDLFIDEFLAKFEARYARK